MDKNMQVKMNLINRKHSIRYITAVGDNYGKGSKRGGDVHNNDGRIEEGEEQQLLNDSLSLLHHSWPYSQQQQHMAKMMGSSKSIWYGRHQHQQ